MELRELEILTAVVDSGSFSKAAERLKLTQPAISQVISKMEKRLNVSLVERTTPVVPTLAGSRVLQYAQAVFDESNSLESDLADLTKKPIGRLMLGTTQMVAHEYMGDLLRKFHKYIPESSMNVTSLPSRELIYKVENGVFELGFGPFQHRMSQFNTQPCFKQTLNLYAAKDHRLISKLRRGNEKILQELVLITSYLDSPEYRPGKERLRNLFSGVWQISQLSLRLNMIQEGLGIGYLPEKWIKRNLTKKNIVHLKAYTYSSIHRTTGLYYLKSAKLSPISWEFLGFCEDYFSN